MFDVTKLLSDYDQPIGELRSNRRASVAWYDPGGSESAQGLTPEATRAILDDLAAANVRALNFIAERPGSALFEAAAYARDREIEIILLTGTAPLGIETVRAIAHAGIRRVAISGGNRIEDAAANVRALQAARVAVELRIDLDRITIERLDDIFAFLEDEHVENAAFCHHVTSVPLEENETRDALALVFRHARDLTERGEARAISTSGNHADAAFAWLYLEREGSPLAYRAQRFLEWTGAAANAMRLPSAGIEANGDVHPDPDLRAVVVGNAAERPISELWADESNELLVRLRDPRGYLRGRCPDCRFLGSCRGNVRARALAITGDLWASDPGCYLTDDEIAGTAP